MVNEKKTVLGCRICGCKSKELTAADLSELGVPWYCDDCGRRVVDFVEFTDDEFFDDLSHEERSRVIGWYLQRQTGSGKCT